MERKHNAFDDFVDFYKGIYKKSPHTWDIDTENLVPPTLDDHTHVNVSSHYAEDVAKSKAFGKAIFFASEDLEDSHILISKVKEGGKDSLFGEVKIRKDGDVVLTNWLKQQTVEKQTGYQSSSYYQEPEPVDEDPDYDVSDQPNIGQWFGYIVNGSKTVSTHAQDGQYNAGTLKQMENTKEQILKALNALQDWAEDSKTSGKPFVGDIPNPMGGTTHVELQVMEQHEAWKNAMQQLLANIKQVEESKAQGIKVSPHFTQPVYTPSAAAQKEFNDKKAEATAEAGVKDSADYAEKTQFKSDDGAVTITKQADGTWSVLTKGKYSEPMSGDDFNVYVKNEDNGWNLIHDPKEGIGEEEVSTNVKVGSKLLKVTLRSASSKHGDFDGKTGELTLSGNENSSYLNKGQMYEIDFGNTVIEYRPWEGTGTPKSQQGLLRFYKKDWQGDEDSIEEVMDVLRQMGLDLTPATEESMELHYWKHMTNTLRDRVISAKYQKIVDRMQKAFDNNPQMDSSAQLAEYQAAWADAIGQDKVTNAHWLPKFSRWDMAGGSEDGEAFTMGRPFWERPDVTLEELYDQYQKTSNGMLPVSSMGSSLMEVISTGGAYSTEERMRLLGKELSGGSSDSDQGHGSANYIYGRQNKTPGDSFGSVGGWGANVFLHPRVMQRTSTYSYNGDHFGDADLKKTHAYWDVNKFASHSQNSNEIMVKNGFSMIDDAVAILFPSQSMKAAAIKRYHEAGIYTLNGLPLEEVFVTSNAEAKAIQKKVWDNLLKKAKEEANA